MDIQTLTTFFMWCTILNGGILVVWTMFFVFAPDFAYRTQSKFFPIPREAYNVVIYSAIGLFRIFFVVFNLVPFVALLIVG
jgi:hypothetical protein